MKSKIKIFVSLFILLAIIVFSCTERIDLKLGSGTKRIIVDGSISTDSVIQSVILTESVDYYSTEAPPVISGANVSISDGMDVFILQENPIQPGKYETQEKICGKIGKSYTLLISNVDINGDHVMEEYSAKSDLKPVIPADSIQIARVLMPGVTDTGWLVKAFAKNVPGEAWLLFKVIKNQVNLNDSAHKLNFLGYSDGSQPYINGSTVFMSDGTRNQEKLNEGDTVTLEAIGITKEYYDFLNDFNMEYQPKSPIGSGPSSNISTNVLPLNTGMGFFAAYSIKRISIVYHQNIK